MKVSLGGAVTVTATERWLSELRAGRAFLGGASVTPGAGLLAHVQLHNPAASGITVIVFSADVLTPAADSVRLRENNVALGTLEPTPRNLLSGGAAPSAQVRSTGNAAEQGLAVVLWRTSADQLLNLRTTWLYELGPGEGINFIRLTVAAQLIVNWWFIEV